MNNPDPGWRTTHWTRLLSPEALARCAKWAGWPLAELEREYSPSSRVPSIDACLQEPPMRELGPGRAVRCFNPVGSPEHAVAEVAS